MRPIQSLAFIALATFFGFSITSCDQKSTESFTGHINPADSIEELYYSFAPTGDMMRYVSVEIFPDSTGTFHFPDSLLPQQGMFVNILADNGYFGMYLEHGKNSVANITRNNEGELTIKFSGDNADVNTYYNAYTGAFDSMKYFSPDPDNVLPVSEYMANLEKANSELILGLKNIKDEKMREKMAHMSERMYTWTKIRLIMDRAYENNTNEKDDPEYVALVKTIDPNDDASLDCNLLFPWLNMAVNVADSLPVEKAIAQLKVVDEKITNTRTRNALYNQIPYTLYSYGRITPEQGQAFIEEYGKIAKEYPELIDKYALRTQGLADLKAGDAVPYDPTLTTPDGKTIKLSSLYGTPLYIDIWATWCGPCCKEIPELEKLVDRMKDFKGIRFISISTDESVDAWKAKLAKDNPSWEQFIMMPEECSKFMQANGINGIPRFMIIGADGRYINPDAERPSNPEIENILRNI